MKNLTKKIIFGVTIFGLLAFSPVVLGEENDTEEVLKDRLEMLQERAEEILAILEEMEEEEDCKPYLTGYIRFGANNNPEEVQKLQTFLNDHMGESLPVTGFYGEMTLEAVKNLQVEYKSEILEPWGITEPTGYVYKTTQRKINDIKCPGESLPMPELVPDTTVAQEEVEEVVGEEIEVEEEDVAGEWESVPMEDPEIIDGEETDEEDATPTTEGMLEADIGEGGRGGENTIAWLVVIFGSIGLGVTLYHIYTFRPQQ